MAAGAISDCSQRLLRHGTKKAHHVLVSGRAALILVLVANLIEEWRMDCASMSGAAISGVIDRRLEASATINQIVPDSGAGLDFPGLPVIRDDR